MALLGACVLVALLLLYAFGTERSGLTWDDARQYALMAEDPSQLTRLPYAFRILTPLIVHGLPFETTTAFSIVTIGSLWCAALLLYVFIRTLGLGTTAARAAVVLFVGSGLTIRALTTPLYVDALQYAVELAAFTCILTRRDVLLVATLTIGVLNRETTLLLIPVYLLQARAEQRLGRSDLVRAGLVVLVPVLALVATIVARLILGGALESGLEPLMPRARTFQQNVPSLQDLADIYSVFGAAWLLALLNLRRAPPILRCGLVYGALVVLQLSISRGDEGRNLSHLLPLVIPLAALEFRHLGPATAAAVAFGCVASTINFRWTLFAPTGLRYALVAIGTTATLGVAGWGRLTARGGWRAAAP